MKKLRTPVESIEGKRKKELVGSIREDICLHPTSPAHSKSVEAYEIAVLQIQEGLSYDLHNNKITNRNIYIRKIRTKIALILPLCIPRNIYLFFASNIRIS